MRQLGQRLGNNVGRAKVGDMRTIVRKRNITVNLPRVETLCSRLRSKLGPAKLNWILHTGNILAIGAASSDDMLQLRTCMACASGCSILFNMLQPRPLWNPAAWSLFFLTMHSYQIRRILLENQPLQLSPREHELYERAFMPFGFTPRTFKTLMRNADCQWEVIEPGDAIAKAGHNQKRAAFVMDGTVQVFSSPDLMVNRISVMPEKTHGGWTAHPWHSEIDERGIRRWKQTLIAETRVHLVSFDIRKFSEYVQQNPKLIMASERLQIEDLWGRLRGSHAERLRQIDELKAQLDEQVLEAYFAMIQIAVSDGILTHEEIESCDNYRREHGITDAQHDKVMHQVGWCSSDFTPGTCTQFARSKFLMKSTPQSATS